MLIDNQKFNLAIGAMSAKWGKKIAVLRYMKNLADLAVLED